MLHQNYSTSYSENIRKTAKDSLKIQHFSFIHCTFSHFQKASKDRVRQAYRGREIYNCDATTENLLSARGGTWRTPSLNYLSGLGRLILEMGFVRCIDPSLGWAFKVIISI